MRGCARRLRACPGAGEPGSGQASAGRLGEAQAQPDRGRLRHSQPRGSATPPGAFGKSAVSKVTCQTRSVGPRPRINGTGDPPPADQGMRAVWQLQMCTRCAFLRPQTLGCCGSCVACGGRWAAWSGQGQGISGHQLSSEAMRRALPRWPSPFPLSHPTRCLRSSSGHRTGCASAGAAARC